MATKSTKKSPLQYVGLALFTLSLLIFTLMLGLDRYEINEADFIEAVVPAWQQGPVAEFRTEAYQAAAEKAGFLGQSYGSSFAFSDAFSQVYKDAQQMIADRIEAGELPEGISEWDVRLPDAIYSKGDLFTLAQSAEVGPVQGNPWLFFLLTIGLGLLGGLLYILPKFSAPPGIKHDHIYHNPLTRGLTLGWRSLALGAGIVGTLLYGMKYLAGNWFWPLVSAGIAALIIALVLFVERSWKQSPARSAGPEMMSGYLGILGGVYLIGFYILLYWAPHHITPWVTMVSPLKEAVFGTPASQWFLYGFMYTVIIIVMGVRMMAKYQHNKYQIVRTLSVMFFQTAFAFIIPEILGTLNLPAQDLKNIWPLDYDFFFGWQLDQFKSSGAIGMFMLFWGVILIIIGVPLMVHLVGKRWYCSWVCGCGGLAETMGDPWRQLSDKSLRAWKFERWIIHGVLLAAILMTGLTLYSYFGGSSKVLGLETWRVQRWYGFLIGAGFAGIVGTGFYPLMGNRVWCRFGCPLAAYLGLVQRFQSRFRITTNGGQCISCGNCSTYCEMGIDVRSYAQRGQDIVRASCVGCGVCAAVCPRGVLRLENASGDVSERTQAIRTIHVTEDQISIMV
ncbi:MAG: 4Fe-4S dicluster domain-containing protein [Bacteroidota bacterium]